MERAVSCHTAGDQFVPPVLIGHHNYLEACSVQFLLADDEVVEQIRESLDDIPMMGGYTVGSDDWHTGEVAEVH